MAKPYTFHDIKLILKNELKKTKHILTYGTIGSHKIERDIDTIITKKAKSKTSDFYKEIHNLFDKINLILNTKYSSKLICFNMFEPEMLKLSKIKKDDLVFQVFPYISFGQIKRDWEPYMFENEESVEKFLNNNYTCILGDKKDIFNSNFLKKCYYDPIYLRLETYDRICSNYDEKLLVKTMNHYFDFIFRKRLNKKIKIAKNKSEVKEIFYRLCDTIDKLEKNKK